MLLKSRACEGKRIGGIDARAQNGGCVGAEVMETVVQ